MMADQCDICGKPIVSPYGNSDILIAGYAPDEWDYTKGYAFTGRKGKILQTELDRVGIDLWSCRVAYLWYHEPNDNEECYQRNMKELTLEMAGRKVLLLGSALVKAMTGENVMDWCGLKMQSPTFPLSMQWAIVAPDPAQVEHSTIGELRLAIEKVGRLIKNG